MKTGRDPFARETITKRTAAGTCDFCGQSNRYGKVWIYRVERDGVSVNRSSDIPGQFCSVSCCNAYHGE